MRQPFKDGDGQHLVVEDLSPVDEALVGGDDRAGSFGTVALCYEARSGGTSRAVGKRSPVPHTVSTLSSRNVQQ